MKNSPFRFNLVMSLLAGVMITAAVHFGGSGGCGDDGIGGGGTGGGGAECASPCTSNSGCETFFQNSGIVDDDEAAATAVCLASGECEADCGADENGAAGCVAEAEAGGAACDSGNICTVCPE